MSEPAPETPWDVVKRMRAEGQTREAIAARLTAMGLEADDIKVLLMEEPPKGSSGIDVGPVAAAAAVLVAGPILGGLALAAMGDRVAEREEAGPQAPLGLLQLFVRSRWPGIVAAVCALGFLVFVVATGGFDALMLLWLVAFAVLVAMLSAMGTARKAWRG